MSSDVQAKCTNSSRDCQAGWSPSLRLSRYSTALTSWLVSRSIAFTACGVGVGESVGDGGDGAQVRRRSGPAVPGSRGSAASTCSQAISTRTRARIRPASLKISRSSAQPRSVAAVDRGEGRQGGEAHAAIREVLRSRMIPQGPSAAPADSPRSTTMSANDYRVERDSMGEIRVPARRPVGRADPARGPEFPDQRPADAARVHPRPRTDQVGRRRRQPRARRPRQGRVASRSSGPRSRWPTGRHDAQFPIDVFQTGSGTSSNMNANEVIARLASQYVGRRAGAPERSRQPRPEQQRRDPDGDPPERGAGAGRAAAAGAQGADRDASARKAGDVGETVKTGRTHLMDAMPLTLGQELGGWRAQIEDGVARLQGVPASAARPRAGRHGRRHGHQCPSGVRRERRGAAVAADRRSTCVPARDFFAALSSQDTAVELSGQLRTLAVSLMKIANDLRWMNSGPLAGLARNRAARAAAGQQHHAGQGQPGRPRGGRDGCGPGDRQRRDDHDRWAVGQFPAERDAAGDRVQPAAEHRAAGRRVARARAQRHRGIRGERARRSRRRSSATRCW